MSFVIASLSSNRICGGLVACSGRTSNFKRYAHSEFQIVRLINFTHAPGADETFDTETRS